MSEEIEAAHSPQLVVAWSAGNSHFEGFFVQVK